MRDLDYSQPSIFSYFSSKQISWELDASDKANSEGVGCAMRESRLLSVKKELREAVNSICKTKTIKSVIFEVNMAVPNKYRSPTLGH